MWRFPFLERPVALWSAVRTTQEPVRGGRARGASYQKGVESAFTHSCEQSEASPTTCTAVTAGGSTTLAIPHAGASGSRDGRGRSRCSSGATRNGTRATDFERGAHTGGSRRGHRAARDTVGLGNRRGRAIRAVDGSDDVAPDDCAPRDGLPLVLLCPPARPDGGGSISSRRTGKNEVRGGTA